MRTVRPVAVAVAVTVLIASCAGDGTQDTDTRSDSAESVGARLEDGTGQLTIEETPVVDGGYLPPGAEPLWSVELASTPVFTEARMVGLIYPDSVEPDLSVVGVDAAGTPRWRITTNPSCAGFGLTRHDDRDLVVVLDSDADVETGELATRTTATAFDADDGAIVWGPVDVPGALRGPGLIFGESPGSIVTDELGPRVMLSVADGSVVADETAGDIVHYEHHGVGVFERDGTLQARDVITGDLLWTDAEIDPPGDVEPGAVPAPMTGVAASAGTTIVLAWPGRSTETVYAAHDVRTGALLDRLPGKPDSASLVDPVSGTTLVTTSGPNGRRMSAVEPGGTRWSRPVSDAASVDVVVGDVVYGRNGRHGWVVSLVDGTTLTEGAWTPPVAAMPAGPAIVPAPVSDRERYLAVSLRP